MSDCVHCVVMFVSGGGMQQCRGLDNLDIYLISYLFLSVHKNILHCGYNL